MEASFIEQLLILVASIILGLGLGALYDIIRIIRALLGLSYINKFTEKLKRLKPRFIKNPFDRKSRQGGTFEKIIVFVTDILYFLVITLIMMIYIYHMNSGIPRWYIFVGAIAGAFLYYFTIGKLVISISEYIVFSLKLIFAYFTYFISRPFVILFLKIKPLFSKIKFKKKIKNKEKLNTEKARTELIKIGK